MFNLDLRNVNYQGSGYAIVRTNNGETFVGRYGAHHGLLHLVDAFKYTCLTEEIPEIKEKSKKFNTTKFGEVFIPKQSIDFICSLPENWKP